VHYAHCLQYTVSVKPLRRSDFARPYSNSALRAATRSNPRNLPCPTCKAPNRLTPADARRGYQCDACADREEGAY
jgi:hypothetical protein